MEDLLRSGLGCFLAASNLMTLIGVVLATVRIGARILGRR